MDTAQQQLDLLATLRTSSYGLAFVLSAQYLGIDAEAGTILLLLMCLDVVTGVVRSAVVNGLPSIRSTVGTRGLLSKLLTLSGVLSVALAFKGIGYNAAPAIAGIVSVFILSEAYSIVGNVHSAVTRQPKAEYDALEFLIAMVRKVLDKYTGKEVTNNDTNNV